MGETGSRKPVQATSSTPLACSCILLRPLFHIFFFFFCLFGAAPAAYGGSQARGLTGAVASGLHQSHSNVGSESHLRPTPQLTATPDR